MKITYSLRLTLFGATRKLQLNPTVENLNEAIQTVRSHGSGISAELLVTDEDTVLAQITRDQVYDMLRPHLKAFPITVKGKGDFQSEASRNPTKDLATWLLS